MWIRCLRLDDASEAFQSETSVACTASECSASSLPGKTGDGEEVQAQTINDPGSRVQSRRFAGRQRVLAEERRAEAAAAGERPIAEWRRSPDDSLEESPQQLLNNQALS